MTRRTILLVPLSLLVAGCMHVPSPTPQPLSSPTEKQMESFSSTTFQTPKKSAHYESNTPAHGMILPAPPVNVVIDVNFDLVAPSSISITKDGKEYGVGETTIDRNKLAMRRTIDTFTNASTSGIYDVTYRACWPDRSCHDGSFQFAVDLSLTESFSDQRFKEGAEVRMKDIQFQPMNIRISSGSTVTWFNDDAVDHYVNTDSHPAHIYVPDHNSTLLKPGDSYSYTFTNPGRATYPYHCSAHAETMTGMIVVE